LHRTQDRQSGARNPALAVSREIHNTPPALARMTDSNRFRQRSSPGSPELPTRAD
ncbi:unnamed protein product, partial [marine sediment metagenome]